jgi:hypothetical protein
VVSPATGRRGASRLGCLIQLVVLVSIIYFGFLAGEEALAYYRFKDAMKNEARFASIRTDVEIRKRLRAFTDSVKLPAEAKEINVVRDGNEIHIWSEYDQVIRLPFNKTRIVHLRPSVEKTF